MAERIASCISQGCRSLPIYTFAHPVWGPSPLCLDHLSWSLTEAYKAAKPERTRGRPELVALADAIVGGLAARMMAGLLPRDASDAQVMAVADGVALAMFGVRNVRETPTDKMAIAAKFMRAEANGVANAIEEMIRGRQVGTQPTG